MPLNNTVKRSEWERPMRRAAESFSPRRQGRFQFGFLPNHIIEDNCGRAGRLLGLLLEEEQLLGLGGNLLERLHVLAKFFFRLW